MFVLIWGVCNPGSCWSVYFACVFQSRVALVFVLFVCVYVFAIQGHAGLRKHVFAIEGRAGLCIAFARLQSTVVCNPGLHGVFAFCNAGSCWSVLFLCFREAGMGWFGYCCCTMLDRSVVGKCWG